MIKNLWSGFVKHLLYVSEQPGLLFYLIPKGFMHFDLVLCFIGLVSPVPITPRVMLVLTAVFFINSILLNMPSHKFLMFVSSFKGLFALTTVLLGVTNLSIYSLMGAVLVDLTFLILSVMYGKKLWYVVAPYFCNHEETKPVSYYSKGSGLQRCVLCGKEFFIDENN